MQHVKRRMYNNSTTYIVSFYKNKRFKYFYLVVSVMNGPNVCVLSVRRFKSNVIFVKHNHYPVMRRWCRLKNAHR